MPEYKAGVCNIGENEIRKRYALAVIAFVLSALVVYVVLLYNLPRLTLLISFIPLLMAFEGFYQGYLKFCAGFAAAGVCDVGDSKKKVANLKDHSKDMQKAKQIHIYSIISGIIIAIIIYLLA